MILKRNGKKRILMNRLPDIGYINYVERNSSKEIMGLFFFDSLNEEDLELEKELEKAQENYIFQEELYIVDRIYNEIGWEEFLSYRDNCYYKDMIKVFTDYYVPCAQCSFYCPEYERCKGNVEEMQKRKETIIEKFVAAGFKNEEISLGSFSKSC